MNRIPESACGDNDSTQRITARDAYSDRNVNIPRPYPQTSIFTPENDSDEILTKGLMFSIRWEAENRVSVPRGILNELASSVPARARRGRPAGATARLLSVNALTLPRQSAAKGYQHRNRSALP